MKIELTTTEQPASTIAEHGTIEGLDASVHTLPTQVACRLTLWTGGITSVSCHRPTRGEAIAEAVRMARACGMIGE